ncbi:MAG: radical SAM protein [Spirochaetes bacterium]|nr:radical SAM protein [Spirochaetota bacterium]
MLTSELQAVHFQLTRTCNLRCRMCGQWGIHGYQREHIREPELTRDDWFRIIDELKPPMNITLWGGEPFIAPFCLDVAHRLRERNFKVSIVTNGVLLEKYASELDGLFGTIFISVDGTAPIHDNVRGVAGTFAHIDAGIRKLRSVLPKQVICIKTTLVRENIDNLPQLAPFIRSWGVQHWSLDPQMFLSAKRMQPYAAFEKQFGVDNITAESWRDEFGPGYGKQVSSALRELIAANSDLRIGIGGHGMTAESVIDWYEAPDTDIAAHHCYAPFRRLSIQSNGNTSFCLDITDGSFGNVRERSIEEIFTSPDAVRYRNAIMAEQNPACIRCVWKRHPEAYR